MRRLIILAVLSAPSVFGAEDLLGLVTTWQASSPVPPATGTQQAGKLIGFARDNNNQVGALGTWFVQPCFDDPTFVTGCDTAFQNDASSNAWTYVIPSTSVGGVIPRDGNLHLLYLKINSHSNPGAGDVVVSGSPFPVKYNVASGVFDRMWTAALETSPAPMSASVLAVITLAGSTYSLGSTGTPVCSNVGSLTGVPGTTTIYPDGAAGAYMLKYSIPCSNARVVTLTQSGGYITQANFTSQLLPTITDLPAAIQGIALAWVSPGQISPTTAANGPRGLSASVAYGSFPTGTSLANNLVLGPLNPYFNSTSKTPFTTHAIRPTMMLVGETCTGTCGTSSLNQYSASVWAESATQFASNLNNSYAARGTNPTGNIEWNITGDASGRQTMAFAASSLQIGSNTYGTGINGVMNGTAASFTSTNPILGTNILAIQTSSPSWSLGSTTYKAGCLATAETSTSGFLPQDTGNNQTPIAEFLNAGCSAAYSTAVEPGTLPLFKNLDLGLAMNHYISGETTLEALWKAVRLPWQGNFVGDPLAAAYTSAAGPGPQTTLRNVTLRGVTVQ